MPACKSRKERGKHEKSLLHAEKGTNNHLINQPQNVTLEHHFSFFLHGCHSTNHLCRVEILVLVWWHSCVEVG